MSTSGGHPAQSPRDQLRSQPGVGRVLTGWEQSRLSWARVPESYDEVPAAYRAWLDPLVQGREPFPYIVLTPTYEGYFRRENERLVCLQDGTLYIVERSRDRLMPVAYRLDRISYIETGSILLCGWLTVRGLDEGGILSSTTLKFNTVSDRLFAPFLAEIRSGSRAPSGTSLDVERAKFGDLLRRNYKFMNYSRGSILPGEEVLCYVLQPEVREPLLRLFGRSVSRCLSPTHIAILTDQELIAIREEDGSLWQSFSTIKYGGIWQYVPLARILAASVTMGEDGLLTLSIRLPHEERLERRFSPDLGSELDSLVKKLEGLILDAPRWRG